MHSKTNRFERDRRLAAHVGNLTRVGKNQAEAAQRWAGIPPEIFPQKKVRLVLRIERPTGQIQLWEKCGKHFFVR